jgi:ectoine hydroxylase-related dioxygenase (phytanoyl-CoA dioxygenase family)
MRSGVERGARAALGRSGPSWHRNANTLPWFDQADALDHARTLGKHASAEEAALLEKWVRDGYAIVDDCVVDTDVDEMLSGLDNLWDAKHPIANLEILGLRESPAEEPRSLSHAQLLSLDHAARDRIRQHSDWRIHGFHYLNPAAARVFSSRRLRRYANLLFGKKARPFAVINFPAGSQQDLHQDMAVFHIYPHNYLLGAWIACEDISADAGPLVFYPGSHRVPLFPGFTDYPQTNLRTATGTLAHRYQEYVDALATQFPRREFLPRKGQILLWHGMLIHGGSPITRAGSTRRSMVIHYTVRGADRGREIHGPFRW